MRSEQRLMVFLVDDHELVRRGFADLLREDGGFEVVGEASSVREALVLIELTEPDVAILDVRLPDGDGITLCREIGVHGLRTRCLVLTAYGTPGELASAASAGASGYLLKDVKGGELIEAIRTIGNGGSLFDPALVNRGEGGNGSQASR